jgi:inward rectifier potassium channel
VSPLHGVTQEAFAQSEPEVLILLSAVEEAFSQTVHTRSSYKSEEIIWGAKFSDMYVPDSNGMMTIDLNKLHEIEKIS